LRRELDLRNPLSLSDPLWPGFCISASANIRP
jgi:hypothetical protein